MPYLYIKHKDYTFLHKRVLQRYRCTVMLSDNNTMAFWHISLAKYLKNVMLQSYLSKFIFIFLVTPSAAGSQVSCNLFESVCQWLMTLISVRSPHRAIIWLQKIREKHLNYIYICINSFSRHICPNRLTFMMLICPDSLYMFFITRKEQPEHSSNILLLCSTEESRSYRFGTGVPHMSGKVKLWALWSPPGGWLQCRS